MKKLNLFSDLWSSVAGSQRNDVEFDRRLTVGSPSGFTINWTLKLVSVLVLVLTIGSGNVWGADATMTGVTNPTAVTVNSKSGFKCATSKKSGSMKITVPSGATSISFYISGWGNDGTEVSVTPTDKVNTTSVTPSVDACFTGNGTTFTTNSSESTYACTITLNSITANTDITFSSGNGKRFIIWGATYSTGGGSTPSLTADPTSLDWGTVLQGSSQSTKTISISGSNLTAGSLTIGATGGYSVTPTSKGVSGTLSATTLTITPPSTATAGTKNGKVTISGGGLASNVEVNLTMTVQASHTVTWMVNGSEHATTQVVSGGHPVFPSVPSSCDAGKVFVGWTETNIGSSETDTPPTFITTATTISSDKTYYAVFAKKGDFIRVTGPSSLANGQLLVIVSNKYSTAITNGIGYTTAPTESSSKVTATDAMTWLLTGNSTSGWAISKIANGYLLGYASNPSSNSSTAATLASNNSCSTWGIGQNSYTSNVLYISNKSTASCALEASSSSANWVVYNSSSYNSNQYCALRVYASTLSKFITTCCATNVSLSHNSPEHGTIAFGSTSVATCGGDQNVSLTITPDAGYQLATYSVATGSGKVATKNDPGISLNNNSNAVQNKTLTFASGVNGAYEVTASFTKMAPTACVWKYKSAAIPNPINLYVGQTAQLDATYTPSGLLNSEQDYTVTKSANLTQTSKTYSSPDVHYTFRADAAMDEGTVTLTNKINTSLSTTVHVHVDELPRVHFVDLVHGKEFADVVATISDNALNPNKTMKTSVDWTTPNANDCEEQHLHLAGWILSTWADANPDATHSEIAGAGATNFYAPGAAINVLTNNGNTYYAVWAKEE